jgi:predicted lipid carrier protein YhbT
LPPQLANVVARLPVAPPSLAFSAVATRLRWPALKTLDWQALAGRRYAIRVKDIGLSLRFTVTQRGFAPTMAHPTSPSVPARDFCCCSRREDPIPF